MPADNFNQRRLASAFDSLLTQNQRALDQLMGKRPQSGRQPSGHTRSHGDSLVLDMTSTQQLDERFGSGWQFAIIDRYIEDDEAVVIGQLNLPAEGLSVSQSGRAPIQPNKQASPATGNVAGSADGVSFAIDLDQSANVDTTPNDRNAQHWQDALANAVNNCLDWI